MAICLDPDVPQYGTDLCRDIRNEKQRPELIRKVFENLIIRDVLSSQPRREQQLCGPNNQDCRQRATTIWAELREIADAFNEPGRFTAFVGYEWTGNAGGSNMHRNIIFRNNNVPALPVTYFEANTAPELWRLLRLGCSGNCELVVIPHNSNQSRGNQFEDTIYTPALARLRQTMEPLVEIIQAKGESECHTGIGTVDELCGFEKLDKRPLCGASENTEGCAVMCDDNGKPDNCVWARNYVRNALKNGLKVEQTLGVNPFKFGDPGVECAPDC